VLSIQICRIYDLTTNLFLYELFCVFPVCYDVRLSHLNKYYLLTYLLTFVYTGTMVYTRRLKARKGDELPRNGLFYL